MGRVRVLVLFAICSLAVFVTTSPVFADKGGNGNGNNGNGNGNGGPGSPSLPEVPFALLLPIIGLAVVGIVCAVMYARRPKSVNSPR